MSFIMTFPVHISLCFAYICPSLPSPAYPLPPPPHGAPCTFAAFTLKSGFCIWEKAQVIVSFLPLTTLCPHLSLPCLRPPFPPYCAHLLPCPIHSICLNIGHIQGCICSQLESTQERKHAGVGHPGSVNSIHLPEDDVISFFLTAK